MEITKHNFPEWAKVRGDGWEYIGWVPRIGIVGSKTFEELVSREKQSVHGEEREVDIYPEGATCWYREKSRE